MALYAVFICPMRHEHLLSLKVKVTSALSPPFLFIHIHFILNYEIFFLSLLQAAVLGECPAPEPVSLQFL